MTAPCPHCGSTVSSPPPPSAVPAGDAPAKLSSEPSRTVPPPPGSDGPGSPPPMPSGAPAAPGRKRAEPAALKGPAVENLVSVPAGRGEPEPPERLDPLPGAELPEREESADRRKTRRGIHPAIPFLVAILLIVGVLVGLIVMKRKDPDPGPPVAATPPAPKKDDEARMRFLRDGWKEHSSNTLASFLRAGSVEQKARFVVGGGERIDAMRAFYGETQELAETDPPAEVFSHFDLDIADKKRGLFLMRYERPAQFEMTEFFTPVAPLEVQHNIEPPDLLLSAFAARENFAAEPVRIMAFFKEVDDRLLLDWEVYAQTKYRTLRHFLTYPLAGHSSVFRVMAREEFPAHSGVDLAKYRYFSFSDPEHAQDKMTLPVAMDSTPGRILADLAWVNIPGKQAQARYATVELAWSQEEEPRPTLKRVLCWEFLGLGGVEGNADPVGLPDSPLDPIELGADPLAPPAPGPEPGEPVSVPGTPSTPDADAEVPSGDLPPGGPSKPAGPTPGPEAPVVP